jgi:hypothetical protein
MPMTVAGTITGYELLNCTNGTNCTLGPQLFTVHISGTGTAQLTLSSDTYIIQGANIAFSGTATTVPEPVSLILTGTGLAGILVKRKVGEAKRVCRWRRNA